MPIVLLIGDHATAFVPILERLPRKPAWCDAAPIVVADSQGGELMAAARASVARHFGPGGRQGGAIILDINWGDGAATMGCDFIHWLRGNGYHLPVLVRSAYVHPDGSTTDLIQRKLSPALGWHPWTGDSLDKGWPPALSSSEMALAQDTASRLLQHAEGPGIASQIRARARRALYGQAIDWGEFDNLVMRLGPLPSASPEYRSAFQQLHSAVSGQNERAILDALATLEVAFGHREELSG